MNASRRKGEVAMTDTEIFERAAEILPTIPQGCSNRLFDALNIACVELCQEPIQKGFPLGSAFGFRVLAYAKAYPSLSCDNAEEYMARLTDYVREKEK
jgi:hypothetical protein